VYEVNFWDSAHSSEGFLENWTWQDALLSNNADKLDLDIMKKIRISEQSKFGALIVTGTGGPFFHSQQEQAQCCLFTALTCTVPCPNFDWSKL